MRDALSLLDQAIAHGAGRIALEDVRAMLGAIDESYLLRLVEAVGREDGAHVMAIADEMQARSLSFDGALRDLASLLLKVALAQTVPAALDADAAEREPLQALAARLDPETVQLYYQIALQGRDDLPLAPDEHAGFVMTLLRMLAFRPEGGAAQATAPAEAPGAPLAPPAKRRAPQPAEFDGDWPSLAARLPLGGLARELARHAELRSFANGVFELVVPRAMAHLAGNGYRDKLKAALEQHFGRQIGLRVTAGETRAASAAALESSDREARRAEAARSVQGDRFVQDMVSLFDARVIESSVQAKRDNGGGNG
jgi:DNA polymerase-3 subunit gamma/tau